MLSTLARALALSVSLVHAFQDTSPLFMFSTSELLTTSPQITPADSITYKILSELKRCPSDTYVIVKQPGVTAEDYSDRFAAPHLRRKVLGEDTQIRSSIAVNDVIGTVDAEAMIKIVEDECGAGILRVDASTGAFAIADDMKPRIINLDFPALPNTSRHQRAPKLIEHALPSSKYTLVYTTTPSSHSSPISQEDPELEPYEMDTSFSSQTHMELKRDFQIHNHNKRADENENQNITLPDAPLFEKYQYFTPGIFMGILVMLPLFLILYVGVSAVGSLQVSYAAFDKEMGPAGQGPKKGQ